MATSEDEYELNGPDADAQGVLTDDGFLVKAGSLARRETVPDGAESAKTDQARFLRSCKERQRNLCLTNSPPFMNKVGGAGRDH